MKNFANQYFKSSAFVLFDFLDNLQTLWNNKAKIITEDDYNMFINKQCAVDVWSYCPHYHHF